MHNLVDSYICGGFKTKKTNLIYQPMLLSDGIFINHAKVACDMYVLIKLLYFYGIKFIKTGFCGTKFCWNTVYLDDIPTSEFATPLACRVECQQRRGCRLLIGHAYQDSRETNFNKELSGRASQQFCINFAHS